MNKIVIVFICFLFSDISTFSQGFTIQGKWKFTLEDKREFSKPEYNDNDWTDLEVLRWSDNVNKTANRVLWIRKSVVIPSSLKTEFEKTGALTLNMGKIEQSDQTWLNGKLIGATGSGDSYRNYLIKKDDILWDQENMIAIRIGHWGTFSMSIIPQISAAAPEYFFVFSSGLKDGVPKQQVGKKDLIYQLYVANNSIKPVEGSVKADFYNFAGTMIFSTQKNVTLSIGSNPIDFPYNSALPFVKIVYSLSVPSYKFTGYWNAEFGYDDIVYQSLQPVVSYKSKDRYSPAGLDKQLIRGWLGDRMKANTEKRLYKVDEKALLEGFINRPGSHSWIGEHVGKFLEAACNAYANSGDPMLKNQIDRSAQQLIAAQLSDGYLGTYDMDSHWTSWDLWSHKYDLVGLLSYYQLSGFKPALTAAEKIGDLICQTFGYEKGKIDIIKAGAHVGMAATSVLDPMTELYRFSGNAKYLDFCFYITRSFNNLNGPRIISTLDSVGRVDKVANAKAYEMLSNLVGLVKLYRITSDEQYLKPVLAAWSDIVANRLYITGAASSFEHFQDDHILPAEANSNMGEGCVTTTWTQFNYQLFSIFGEIKYLDELERVVYNHLTGAENPQTGGVSYYMPLNGTKPYRTSITCCMSSIPRGIAMIPLFANGKIDQIPSFLFYQPGVYKTVAGNNEKTAVEFVTDTHFPDDGNVSITVNPAKSAKFKVLMRKPYWADDFTISINKVKQKTDSKDMATIERLWKEGDKIEVSFKIPVKILDGNISYPGQIAIQRGPQVLVFDQLLNKSNSSEVALSDKLINLESASSVLPENWVGTQAYQVNVEINGVPKKLILVPYADAGQTGGVIETWLKKKY